MASTRDRLMPYRRKRDFARTPEPAAERAPTSTSQRRFVVQRHRARRLHYDLRLEVDEVLVSWAVPKGPTLDPKVRRVAIPTEDHPLEYYDFEGVIPAGEYGGGDVIVWDRGTWTPAEAPDPARALSTGELHFDLSGQKLRGRFVLVRTGSGRTSDTGSESSDRDQWLLLHKRDEFAVDGWDPENHPQSVLSGRTSDEVRADPDRLWRGDLPAQTASIALKPSTWDSAPAAELAQLDDLATEGRWAIFGRELRVTNLDKELFPARKAERPVTKRDLLRYAARIAPVAGPYLSRRGLNLHRFPDGAAGKGFWQRDLPDHAPSWLPRWEHDGTTQLVVDEPAALVWAANFGVLEWHAWTSRVDDPEQPTYALIDIDPGSDSSWADVLTLARLHRTAIEHLGIVARPKLTGRRGIQIWVPIARGVPFGRTRAWVQGLSKAIGEVVPDLVSWQWQKRERGGLARLDYTQNAINKTLVAPYSPRPAAGAPISAPIDWSELDDPTLRPDKFTVRTIIGRIQKRGDLFADVLHSGQSLPALR
jgi:bifunctional non-homologous end joining protein LigD